MRIGEVMVKLAHLLLQLYACEGSTSNNLIRTKREVCVIITVILLIIMKE